MLKTAAFPIYDFDIGSVWKIVESDEGSFIERVEHPERLAAYNSSGYPFGPGAEHRVPATEYKTHQEKAIGIPAGDGKLEPGEDPEQEDDIMVDSLFGEPPEEGDDKEDGDIGGTPPHAGQTTNTHGNMPMGTWGP